mmetsp:Transcript_69507/g.176392  ORF Transcript_69507/g.176392 Transcript_69507/m.176392 type:complete len:264 (+) Transcript_69507:88-879(+)
MECAAPCARCSCVGSHLASHQLTHDMLHLHVDACEVLVRRQSSLVLHDSALHVLGGEAKLLLDLGGDDGLGRQSDRLHVVNGGLGLGLGIVHVPRDVLQLLEHEVVGIDHLLDRNLLGRLEGAIRSTHDLHDALPDLKVGLVLAQQLVELLHLETIPLKDVVGLDLLDLLIGLVERSRLGHDLRCQALHAYLHLLLRGVDLIQNLQHLILGDLADGDLLLGTLGMRGRGGLRFVPQQVVEDGGGPSGTADNQQGLLPALHVQQ